MIPAPYSNEDAKSFAAVSVTKRWPAILNGVVTDLQKHKQASSAEAAEEVDEISAKIKDLIKALETNQQLKPLQGNYPDISAYNEELASIAAKGPVTWHNAPWLYSECYMYRLAQLFFTESKHWKSYDMFQDTKEDTFFKSADAVSDLAFRYQQLTQQLAGADASPKERQELLKVLFHEALNTSLWGNATDLSLLVTVSMDEIKKLQVAAENRDADKVLANDFEKVWTQLSTNPGGRVDIVLDNSGFELYTDLILALFLLDTGLAEQLVIHPKSQPWFVSDVTPHDFVSVVRLLQNSEKFPGHRGAIDAVVERLLEYQQDGQIVLRPSAFWTTAAPFWDINENGSAGGAAVWKDLRASKLVIFKGDLNYRKLTGDVEWPRTTPFSEALQQLATAKIPLVSLRTIKADVCVGLPKGKEQELDEAWGKDHPDPQGWAWSGSYAVISACGI